MAIKIEHGETTPANARIQEQARVLAESIISTLDVMDPCTMIDLNDVLELVEWTQGRRVVAELSMTLQERIREAR